MIPHGSDYLSLRNRVLYFLDKYGMSILELTEKENIIHVIFHCIKGGH